MCICPWQWWLFGSLVCFDDRPQSQPKSLIYMIDEVIFEKQPIKFFSTHSGIITWPPYTISKGESQRPLLRFLRTYDIQTTVLKSWISAPFILYLSLLLWVAQNWSARFKALLFALDASRDFLPKRPWSCQIIQISDEKSLTWRKWVERKFNVFAYFRFWS